MEKSENKNSKKKTIGKIVILALSFVLVIMVTFSVTLAWFFDGDDANNSFVMGGAVGIQLVDTDGTNTTGENALNMVIDGDAAYPGQNIGVEVKAKNTGNSACLLRAMFYFTTTIDEGTFATDFNTTIANLITTVNASSAATTAGYKWVSYSYAGTPATTAYYLCSSTVVSGGKECMFSLATNTTVDFLGEAIVQIPTSLTNESAGQTIAFSVVLQAVQTYIPDSTKTGVVDNEVALTALTYDHTDLQTVFSQAFSSGIAAPVYGG